MCQPKPNTADRCKDFQPVVIPIGLAADEFAEYGCLKLLTSVKLDTTCAAFCYNEPRDSCVAFYFSKERKECRLVLFTDATINMGKARGWKKFTTKKFITKK